MGRGQARGDPGVYTAYFGNSEETCAASGQTSGVASTLLYTQLKALGFRTPTLQSSILQPECARTFARV